MKGFASIPQAAEAAAGAPAGSAGSASPPRTSAEWSRTYLQHRVTFDAAKAQCSLGIANLDGLCASMCLIAASNGERAPVRVGVGYHDIGCYWTNLLRCRLGPCGVLSLRALPWCALGGPSGFGGPWPLSRDRVGGQCGCVIAAVLARVCIPTSRAGRDTRAYDALWRVVVCGTPILLHYLQALSSA